MLLLDLDLVGLDYDMVFEGIKEVCDDLGPGQALEHLEMLVKHKPTLQQHPTFTTTLELIVTKIT